MTDLSLRSASKVEHSTAQTEWVQFVGAAPIIAAALFGFLYLGHKSLWLDEVYSISFARLEWSQLFEMISKGEANAGIYYVLLKLWLQIFGTNEFSARSLSVLFAVGAAATTFGIGKHLFGFRSALPAALLLSTNSFFVRYAQEARGYTLMMLIAVLAMWCFVQAVRNQSKRYYVALGVANGLLLYTHFFGFFILVAQALSILFVTRGVMRWDRAIFSGVLTVIIASPLIYFMVTHESSPLGWVTESSLQKLAHVFSLLTGKIHGGILQNMLFALYSLACLGGVYTVARLLRGAGGSQELWPWVLMASWLLTPILGLYLLSLVTPVFVPRYTICSLPALVILVGAGISTLRNRAVYLGVLSLGLMLSLYSLFSVYYTEPKDDWRAAYNFVAEHAQKSDAIVFYGPEAMPPFEYYQRSSGGGSHLLRSVYPCALGAALELDCLEKLVLKPLTNQGVPEVLGDLNGSENRLWVVVAHDISPGFGLDSRPILQELEHRYVRRDSVAVDGIKVSLYEKR